MSHVIRESTTELIWLRLQSLRALHGPAVRSGDEHLRRAMAEYGQSLALQKMREAA